MDKVLLYFALKYEGNWEKIYNALDRKEKIRQENLDQVEKQINCAYLTIINPLYPESLKNSYKPPFVLFYRGEIELLVNAYKIIGLVHTNHLNDYSMREQLRFINAFEKEHKTFMMGEHNYGDEVKMTNRIVLTHSMNHQVAHDHELLLSEAYEPNLELDTERMLFGVARCIFVSEIKRTDHQFDLLKIMVGTSGEIFVIPQQNGSGNSVNNWLIKQGAKLAENPIDILNEF